MKTLWLRFAEDSSLPCRLDETARKRFEAIFDAHNAGSPWCRALGMLGLAATTTWRRMIRWYGDTPYINWSHLVQEISAGTVSALPHADTGFQYKISYRISLLMKLIRSQWTIARYILDRLEPGHPLPADTESRIAESIALGLAMLALTMRLPAHTPATLAGWLADPAALPGNLRRNVIQMQQMQQLRTKLSPAWSEWFPGDEAAHEPTPDYFWDEPPPLRAKQLAVDDNATEWKGLPVAGSAVTGRALFIARVKNADVNAAPRPRILIFPLARPETVELFEHADAVLFGEGGVMSHACTIAREMNLPCITGLGKGFLARMKAGGELWLSLDPQTGQVRLIENPA